MADLDIKNIYQWPLGARIVVIGAVCMIIFLLGYVIDIRSYKSDIANSINQEEDLKRQLQSMLDKQVTLKGNIAQLPAIKALLQEWQQKILARNELPDALNEIMKKGQTNHLKVTSFNPSNEVKDGIYFKTPVSIDLAGTYDQIANYISQLANMKKLVNIDSFTIRKVTDEKNSLESQPLNSDDVLTAQIDIEIYRK